MQENSNEQETFKQETPTPTNNGVYEEMGYQNVPISSLYSLIPTQMPELPKKKKKLAKKVSWVYHYYTEIGTSDKPKQQCNLCDEFQSENGTTHLAYHLNREHNIFETNTDEKALKKKKIEKKKRRKKWSYKWK